MMSGEELLLSSLRQSTDAEAESEISGRSRVTHGTWGKTDLARRVRHGSETDRTLRTQLFQLFHPHSRTDTDDHLSLQRLRHPFLGEDPGYHLRFTAEEDDIALGDRLQVALGSSQDLEAVTARTARRDVFHGVQGLAELPDGLFPADGRDKARRKGSFRGGEGE